nr:phosphoenolpyruvate--protein phosphotransferase [uncultured Actinoplanes sp.]
MVGLVVVSHSRALARAAVALAAEMLHGHDVPLEIAAGLDETTFGTDATAITEAITAADRGDGVVVLMDLGSAVLSAELALDLLEDDDLRERVTLCPAPLIEGLVAAAVSAAAGADRAEVAQEATAGLAGKQSQLGTPPAAGQPQPDTAEESPAASVTVTNPHGLHARPAARLVAEARRFDARVEIRNATTGSPWVPASSLSRVATLGALQGHELSVRASGPRAHEALDALVALAGRAFDETPEMSPQEGDRVAPGGQAASPGVAVGPAWQPRAAVVEIPDDPSQGPEVERSRLLEALDAVRTELDRMRASSAIFDAHLLLLEDTDLLGDVRARIDRGEPAPRAWLVAADRVAREFDELADPYLKARAADVRAVADQVLRMMLGVPAAALDGDGVLIADDLTPAEAAALDPRRVAGVLLASGSPTSHAAIIARTRGIPAVVGLGPSILEVPDGTVVAFDGATAEVVIAPAESVLAGFRSRASSERERRSRAASRAAEPAVTRDGVTILVGANIGSVDDARAAAGADVAGLVRTEFLFLDRDSAPGVDEQVATYRAIASALDGRRITLRTLDVGGDKPLRYLPGPVERNPFLGVRGLRHSLNHPDLFADQLLAIARVARETPVSIMFPMVSAVDELIRARRMLDEAIAQAGRSDDLQVGIMMEVPAAALKAAAFASHVDFFSIGTNDLTQYTLAAERGSAELASLADGLDPGVLRLIDAVCRGAGERVLVAVCGELAADETAIALLTSLGVRELSVAPPLVPATKEVVRATTLDMSGAAAALELPDAAAVRDHGLRPTTA